MTVVPSLIGNGTFEDAEDSMSDDDETDGINEMNDDDMDQEECDERNNMMEQSMMVEQSIDVE